jgi:hypothetical protein
MKVMKGISDLFLQHHAQLLQKGWGNLYHIRLVPHPLGGSTPYHQ